MASFSLPPSDPVTNQSVRRSLSQKLLAMTMLFVFLAEVLIYIPSLTIYRNAWMKDRLAGAATAALVFEAAPMGLVLPEQVVGDILQSIQAQSMAITAGEERRILMATHPLPQVDAEFDRRDETPLEEAVSTFETLLLGQGRIMKVVGEAPKADEFIEIIMDESLLQTALIGYSGNILLISLLISLMTAFLVYLALTWLLVEPMQRLTRNMVRFTEKPEEEERIMRPSGRDDEIGLAEHELMRMQTALRDNIKQKSRLAALGLAVAKINHDLRNMLTGAQLLSDRLAQSHDPTVQRLAPRLMSTIDRAIAFCQSTLSYGRAIEPAPTRTGFALKDLVDEVAQALALQDSGFDFVNAVPASLMLTADREQIDRVLNNLMRNAMQALEGQMEKSIRISARQNETQSIITVADNGPGLPKEARGHLFEAFRSNGRRGSGLGLAIAADLIRNHGGDIQLDDTPQGGASFTITLPQAATEPTLS